jgi:putative peptidoglycan lipid II flippase
VFARSDHESQLVRALGSIGAATLASRILGFARDVVVALAFGAGPLTDAFFVAYRIPNMLRRLLAEGALSTAVVPMFSEYLLRRSRPEFDRLFRAVLAGSLVTLSAVTAVGIAAAPWLVPLLAPGFGADPAQLRLTVTLTRMLFPYLLLVGLAAIAMGALNAHGRFFASALGPAVLNVGMILAVLVLARLIDPPILALAIGVLAGGLGQLLVQLPDLARAEVPLTPSGELRHPALGRMARLLLPSVLGLAVVQVTVFINTLLASLLTTGSISYLYYADRVMEFPLGVFGVALASAALPAMSRQAAAGDRAALGHTVEFALRLSCYVAIPAAVGLVTLATPITRVLFQHGEFGAAETLATGAALTCYAIGLPAFSAARIAVQGFYALGDTRAPVRAAFAALALNVAVAVGLMGPLAHSGLALASSAAGYLNLAVLLWLAARRLGPLAWRELLASVGRTSLASVPVAAWCITLSWLWPVAPRFWVDTAWLIAAVSGGAVLFIAGSALLRSPERAALLGFLPGRAPR